MSRRSDPGVVILTSNLGFSDYNQVFADPVEGDASACRLFHHANALNIHGGG